MGDGVVARLPLPSRCFVCHDRERRGKRPRPAEPARPPAISRCGLWKKEMPAGVVISVAFGARAERAREQGQTATAVWGAPALARCPTPTPSAVPMVVDWGQILISLFAMGESEDRGRKFC